MLKITITIKDNKDNDSCNVAITPQKDLTKATENEKRCGAIVNNKITNALNEIKIK